MVLGKTKGPSPSDLRGKLVDESDNVEENFEALSSAIMEEFQIFPDETTSEKLFNGIKFKDLPFVTIKCHFNHTRFTWIDSPFFCITMHLLKTQHHVVFVEMLLF